MTYATMAEKRPMTSDSFAAPLPTQMARILIVEDNDDARQMLRHLLDLSGHEVYEADDGVRGLEQALGLHPDAVVIDLGLPGLDFNETYLVPVYGPA